MCKQVVCCGGEHVRVGHRNRENQACRVISKNRLKSSL